MTRKYIFECDGCDATRTEEKDIVPPGFSNVTVEISGLGNPYCNRFPGPRVFLLCGSCQQDLSVKSDPDTWPRQKYVGPAMEAPTISEADADAAVMGYLQRCKEAV